MRRGLETCHHHPPDPIRNPGALPFIRISGVAHIEDLLDNPNAASPAQEEPYRMFSTDKNEYLRPFFIVSVQM